MTKYVLGGGCFWCLDAVFRRMRGVLSVETGYAGGPSAPSYYQVATGLTQHAEVVRITFDEAIIPAKVILDIYFLIHNPTTLNRQGADEGPQYRSVMFYADTTQKQAFETAIKRAGKLWKDPIVTELAPLTKFFIAEDEHQDYFTKHPEAGYCHIVIEPKLSDARKEYSQWFKKEET